MTEDHSDKDDEIETLKAKLASATAVALMGLQTSLWRHWLHNQVATISGYIELIRHKLAEDGTVKGLGTYLDGIEEVVSKIMTTAAPTTIDYQRELNLDEFLFEQSARLRSRESDEGIKFRLTSQITPGTSVRADHNLLAYCLDILIDNAVAAMQGSTEKTISIDSQLIGNEKVEVRVTDTGRGVADNIRSKLLETVIIGSQPKGLGFGLLIARMIIQAFGGDIRLAESNIKGTTFVISLLKAG